MGIFAQIIENILPADKDAFEPTFRESELIEDITNFITHNLGDKITRRRYCQSFFDQQKPVELAFQSHA